MVNSCLKKLKYHLASFDIVVKERTTATAITEGTWGFEHTKACFRNDIIPFVKNLKDLFTSFDQYLIDEVSEVQQTFKQMEMAVEQNCAAKTEFQTKMEHVLKQNDYLLKHALGVDIVNIVVNDCMNVNCLTVDACEQCVTTESELKTDFIKKENYEMLFKQYHILEKHCISLELNNQLNTEIFQRDTVSSSESAPTFAELFETNELKAQIQEKDTVILKLKEKIKSLCADDKERKEERVALVSSASGSQSKDNTKKNRIRRTLKKAKETKLEDHPMEKYINSVNASRKSKSAKKPVNRKVWKTTGKVFKTVGYKWTPTGRTFTLVGNVCPLTRIATATIMPPREPKPIVQTTNKLVVTLVYTRKPRSKNVPNKMEPNKSWGSSSNVSTSITDCRLSKSPFGIWTPGAPST
nr:hypothetical protein [Tanacetum cinerariifolium]